MSRSVLVVDDDHETLDVTGAVLRNGGYRVFTASSGKEGLSIARRERPDLILLDINMDDMDGWSTLRLLRLDEEIGSIPVAMFSIRYDLNEKMEALKRSADDYIVKPFSIDDLLDRVARLTKRGRTGADTGRSSGERAWP